MELSRCSCDQPTARLVCVDCGGEVRTEAVNDLLPRGTLVCDICGYPARGYFDSGDVCPVCDTGTLRRDGEDGADVWGDYAGL